MKVFCISLNLVNNIRKKNIIKITDYKQKNCSPASVRFRQLQCDITNRYNKRRENVKFKHFIVQEN